MTIGSDAGRRRALIVDDHGISGRYVSARLRSMGLEVRRARTAAQAVNLALQWRPDLIFMDYHLPDGDGLAASREIRSAWPREEVQPRIFLLSGEDPARIHSGPDAAAVDRVLAKPLRRRDLARAAREEPRSRDREAERRALGEWFGAELRRRLPDLDRELLRMDRSAVCAILHQLIASSAMCRETRLESGLRALDGACRRNDAPSELAPAYYAVITAAREFLKRTDAVRPLRSPPSSP